MPTVDLIISYAVKFGRSLFGSLTLLVIVLTKLFSVESVSVICDRLGKKIQYKKSAFKFSMKVTKS